MKTNKLNLVISQHCLLVDGNNNRVKDMWFNHLSKILPKSIIITKERFRVKQYHSVLAYTLLFFAVLIINLRLCKLINYLGMQILSTLLSMNACCIAAFSSKRSWVFSEHTDYIKFNKSFNHLFFHTKKQNKKQ